MRSRRSADTSVETAHAPSLWRHDFVALLASRSFSNLGTGMAMVAIAYLIITVTDGAIWVAFLAAAYTGAYALGGAIDSFLGDRFDTRKLLAVGQVIEVLGDILLIILWLSGDINGVSLVALGAASGLVTAFEYPAWQVLLKVTVPACRLDRGVAIYASGRSAAVLVGSVGAAVLLRFEFVVPLFIIDIVTYLPVFATLWILRGRPAPNVAKTTDDAPHDADAAAAIRFALRDRTTRWTLVLMGALSLLVGPMTQMLGAAVDWLGTHASFVGWLSAALFLGQAGQAVVIAWAEKRGIMLGLRVMVASTVAAVVLVLIGTSQNPVVAIVGLVAFGAAFGAGKTILLTIIDTVVPAPFLSRAVSLYVVMYALGMLVGVLIWGVVSDQQSFGFTLVLVALGMILFVAAVTISKKIGLIDAARREL